jgi:hypothetical protein
VSIPIIHFVVSPEKNDGRHDSASYDTQDRDHREIIAKVEFLVPNLPHDQTEDHQGDREESKHEDEDKRPLRVAVHGRCENPPLWAATTLGILLERSNKRIGWGGC